MTTTMPVGILMLGVMIGGTIAGFVAHAMHHFADAPKFIERLFLSLYVIVLTIGVSLTYGQPLAVAVSGFLSIFVISRLIFSAVEPHLPKTLGYTPELEIDEESEDQEQE